MKEILRTGKQGCFILYSSIHDLITEFCTTIPWHGCYFNSILQPAENRGLRLCGSCVHVNVYVHMFVCVCMLACMCCSPHVSSDRNLIAVNSPKASAALNRENPRARLSPQHYRALCLLWSALLFLTVGLKPADDGWPSCHNRTFFSFFHSVIPSFHFFVSTF